MPAWSPGRRLLLLVALGAASTVRAERPAVEVRFGIELELDAAQLAGSRALEWFDFVAIETRTRDSTSVLTDRELETFLVDARNWRLLPEATRQAIGSEALENPTRPVSRLAVLREWRKLGRAQRQGIARLSLLPAQARAAVLSRASLGNLPFRTDLPESVAPLVARLAASRDGHGILEFRHRVPLESSRGATADLLALWSYVVPVGSTAPPRDWHLHGSIEDGQSRRDVARALNLVRAARRVASGEIDGVFDATSHVAFRSPREKGLIRLIGENRIELRDGDGDPQREGDALERILRDAPSTSVRNLDAELGRLLTRERLGQIAERSEEVVAQLRFHQHAFPASTVAWRDDDCWNSLDRSERVGPHTLTYRDREDLLATLGTEAATSPAVQRVLARWLADGPYEVLNEQIERAFLRTQVAPGGKTVLAVRAPLTDLSVVLRLIRIARGTRNGSNQARRILGANFGLSPTDPAFSVLGEFPLDMDAAAMFIRRGLAFPDNESPVHGDVRGRARQLESQLGSCSFQAQLLLEPVPGELVW